ncbi:MAG: chorismate synthase [Tissierellia bacterium]|nr:chorismate synthase [Tissierellia bacterium]
MASTFGKKIVTTIFGESHGRGIGVVIDGLPPGEEIDMEELHGFLKRRAPGQSDYTTQRKEEDMPEFLSGLLGNTLTGSPVSAIIRNKDQRSSDYKNILDIPRPSHADYTAYIKYGGNMDMRGGGPFSGRITAPLCVAGGIALQILKRRGVHIAAHLLSAGEIEDCSWDLVTTQVEDLEALKSKDFPTISNESGRKMKAYLGELRQAGDSIGGLIECMAIGLPVGLGEPNYGGFESVLSAAIFSVPGVRGISFGTGFPAAKMKGSEHNDEFEILGGQIRTKTNHGGGVTGGITNGMPIRFHVAMKPTSSISKPQESFSLTENIEKNLVIEGRHDPCIAVRAVPVIEAACALVILDLWEDYYGNKRY